MTSTRIFVRAGCSYAYHVANASNHTNNIDRISPCVRPFVSERNFDKPERDEIPGWVTQNLTAVNMLDYELYNTAVQAVMGATGP